MRKLFNLSVDRDITDRFPGLKLKGNQKTSFLLSKRLLGMSKDLLQFEFPWDEPKKKQDS